MSKHTTTPQRPSARDRLLDGAIAVVRRQGFSATSVAELCAAAGVTKGAFFHHFESKDALGAAAAQHWADTTGALFRNAPYHQPTDPADRVLAYIAFRREIVSGPIAEVTCYAGTLVQEAFASDALRAACSDAIFGHAATLDADIEAALAAADGDFDFTPNSLSRHIQAVLQGSFILAKAAADTGVAVDSVDHLGRYVASLFNRQWSAANGPSR